MREVIPFLKKFESLSQGIRTEAIQKAASMSPQEYGDQLAHAWRAHNLLAIQIDDFLAPHMSVSGAVFEVDQSNIRTVSALMTAALEVERNKRVLSAGVKHLLEPWIKRLQNRGSLSPEDLATALTVRMPNYYVLNHARHIEYWLACVDGGDQPGLEDRLRADFHACNAHVMEGRLSRLGLAIHSRKRLSEMLCRYREMEKRLSDVSLEGDYLSLENDLLKSLRYLITYDNFVEYSFSENLFGIPDLLLRKFTIASLIRQGFLDKREAILHYSDDELLEALKKYEK